MRLKWVFGAGVSEICTFPGLGRHEEAGEHEAEGCGFFVGTDHGLLGELWFTRSLAAVDLAWSADGLPYMVCTAHVLGIGFNDSVQHQIRR